MSELNLNIGYPSLYIYVFLCILVDTESCTLSITKERLDEIYSLVEDWLIRRKCTLKELQSLLPTKVESQDRIQSGVEKSCRNIMDTPL
jgi:hypothetical protein